MKSTQIAFVAGCIVTGVHLVVATVLLLMRRHHYPIKRRSVPLVILAAVGVGAHFTIKSLPRYFDVDECSPFIFHYASLVIALVSMLARIWRLWFLYYLAVERLENAKENFEITTRPSRSDVPVSTMESDAIELRVQGGATGAVISVDTLMEPSDDGDARSSGWFSRHRHWIRDSYLVGGVAVVFLVFYIVLLALYFAFGGDTSKTTAFVPFPDSDNCSAVQAVTMLGNAVSGVVLILILLSGWFLRRVQDAYQMKFELKVVMLSAVVLIVSAQVLTAAGIGEQVTPVVEVFVMQLMLAGFLTFPVVYSFLNTRLVSNSRSSDEIQFPSFSELLHEDSHKNLRESFKEQLLREFCVENYLFYFATLDFESNDERPDVSTAREVIRIYDEFLIENGRNEINISGRLREKVDDELCKSINNFDRIKETLASRRSSRRAFSMMNIRGGTVKLRRGSDVELTKDCDLEAQVELKTSMSSAENEQDKSSGGLKLKRTIDHRVFEPARNEIFELMQRDSFVQWKNKYRREHSS